MSNQLLQLKVVGVAGDGDAAIERDIIATGAMPLFHLHRVLQFTLAPAQWDESIDEKKFKFTHKASRTELKAPKGRQMFKAGPPDTDCLAIGTEWVYECGRVKLEVQLMDKEKGDARKWVPRCIGGSGGNISLDAINKKLLERRFTKTGSYHKEPPKVLVFADASNEEINRIYMNEPLQLLMPDGRTMTIPVE